MTHGRQGNTSSGVLLSFVSFCAKDLNGGNYILQANLWRIKVEKVEFPSNSVGKRLRQWRVMPFLGENAFAKLMSTVGRSCDFMGNGKALFPKK